MKKRIIITMHAMEIGGAEKALLGMLNSFDYENYDIDLFLCRHQGELLKQIPNKINILPSNQAQYLAIPITDLIKSHQFKMLLGRIIGKIQANRIIKKNNIGPDNEVQLTCSHKYTVKYIDKINPNIEYDLAISFLIPHYICREKIKAKKYIAWIHTDYSTLDCDVNSQIDIWSKYDYIASISDNVTKSFINKFPTLESKIIRIDNIITKEMIFNQSLEFDATTEMNSNNIKILSIGRFSIAKNFDNIPDICSKIISKGLNLTWYIIGYGSDEQLIKDKIKESNMERNVIILGKKENPYPYIKACNYYIQPSRYEGKAVTVREAQILCKPVIITDFPTSGSQLIDGVDGIIVSSNNDQCAQDIYDFILNKEKQDKIRHYLINHDYSNSSEVEKLYKLMES